MREAEASVQVRGGGSHWLERGGLTEWFPSHAPQQKDPVA